MVIKGAISDSTIDFADSDTFTLSVAASTSTILGGSGADTLVFTTGADLITSSVSGGADDDSLVFSAVVKSATTIAGGGGDDTLIFNSSVGGATISLDAGADSVSFVTLMSGSTMIGGGGHRPLSLALLQMLEPLVATSVVTLSALVLVTKTSPSKLLL